MAEYDQTDKGAAFTPFPTQQMILQGKVNIKGAEHKIVLVKDQTRDGKQIIELFAKAGVLFENDKKGNDAAPDYSGPVMSHMSRDEQRIAGWRRMKDGKPYMSFQFTDKGDKGMSPKSPTQALNDFNRAEVPPLQIDDDIPPF